MKTSAVRISSLAWCIVVACTPRDEPYAGDTGSAASATAGARDQYTLDQFRALRWIAGRWRGSMANGDRFYEEYRFLNDSTIVKYSFPDSAFVKATDSSRVQLRGGTVADESIRSRYVATRLDSTGIDFAPERGASNHFTWARESSTRWNATLRWTDGKGQPQAVMYAMHRLGR